MNFNIKKIIFFFLYLIILFFNYNLFAELPADIKKIIQKGKLVVAINSVDYPPFFYHNKHGNFEGYDIELANDIAKFLGVKVEFNRSAGTFQDVVKLVQDEHADIAISAISATLSRGLNVRFSEPYLTPNQCLILNRILEVKIGNKAKLNNDQLKVAVLSNSSYEDFFQQNILYFDNIFKTKDFIKYNSLDKILKDVTEEKILGFYADEIYANHIIKNKKIANIYVRKKIITDATDPISIAINWNSPNLAEWINLYIKKLKQSGKTKYLNNKYLRENND
ncbi:MAG: amino acid ABC transporter substrate-binding protein [Spirobacillus cienkowskii]|jgi:polar amino acid transport system substrate-binding protein|uniref:Amino acid ABC transporter substrate-binding protein n=1 Tax=Spirobacillus cienkowskii TaxID=495820 RepID=A0A369KRD4_9BACT|nr:MAG: amino acid ABC transporter substrate-binding protein [Spirobacillus cienkowskii]